METKICNKCNIEKSLEDFGVLRNGTRGNFRKTPYKSNTCKKCLAKQQKEYRDNNPGLWKKYKKPGVITKYPKEERYLMSAIRARVSEAKLNNKRHPNRPFTIDADYMRKVWDKQEGKCIYTDIPLSLETKKPDTLSLDKIIPENGYTKGNIVWTCGSVNRAKGDLEIETFISMCERIVGKCNDYRNLPVTGYLVE